MSDEIETWGWTRYFSYIATFFEEIERQYFASPNRNYCEYVMEKVDMLWRNLSGIRDHIRGNINESQANVLSILNTLNELLRLLPAITEQWQECLDTLDVQSSYSRYRPTVLHSGVRGRPSFVVLREQLEYLKSMSFSWTEIGKLLGVSRMTIYRRRVDYGMLSEPTRPVSDEELFEIVSDVRRELPEIGQSMMGGHLRSIGIHVTRDRMRDAVRRSDPLNTALRWNGITLRRPYSVPGPNSLWHLDGHHKLVRWRFITHGAIDGFSRLIVFLKCSTNNKADTVLWLFQSATQQYGIPSRIRTDYGGENMSVALFMLRARGSDRNSVITGSSSHNQRIERLWKDVHQSVTILYYRLFYFLEDQHILDPLNEIDLFCLHYIYLPRINRALDIFREGWNCHPIRTANHKSPHQLFVAGALQLHQSGLSAVDFFDIVEHSYGIDHEEVPVRLDHGQDSTVVVPHTSIPMSDAVVDQLRRRVNPLVRSSNYGIELYQTSVEIVNDIINQ